MTRDKNLKRKAFFTRVIPIDMTGEVVMFVVEVKQKKPPTLGDNGR